MTKPQLLIVEDDDDIRTQMKWALAAEYDVILAGDRIEALALGRTDQEATRVRATERAVAATKPTAPVRERARPPPVRTDDCRSRPRGRRS